MKNWKIIGTAVLLAATVGIVKLALFSGHELKKDEFIAQQKVKTTSSEVKERLHKRGRKGPFVTFTLLGTNKKGEDVYYIIKRPYNAKSGSKLKVAVTDLLRGPSFSEKSKGMYSEIPSGTKLISIEETSEKTVLNLNDNFENGGGTTSIYKRLYQLIKTSNQNSNTPVYLYINGKQVDVIGGDGIMITQPLNNKSLDN